MKNLKSALWVGGILSFVYGLASFSPSLVSSIFDYEVKDYGLLALDAGLFLSLGILMVAAASNTQKYGGLAGAFALTQVVGIAILVWQWIANVFTLRNALVSIILAAILAVWLWVARPKS